MAYTVMISEAQRKLLVEVLSFEQSRELTRLRIAEHVGDDHERANMRALHSCLQSILEDEQSHPGVLHGLCL